MVLADLLTALSRNYMSRYLGPSLYDSRLLKLLILFSCLITSCYSYNPLYKQASNSSLNPKLGNYRVSFESEIDSELQYLKEDLENFVLTDIQKNIAFGVSDNKATQSGIIYLTINYDYYDYSESVRFLGALTFGLAHLFGFPRAGGTLKVNGDVEIYAENGDFIYYQTIKDQINWTKTLYFKSHTSASHNGIDKRVIENMVYKASNDFLMDFKKKLGRNFNLESINKRTQKDIVRDVSTSNNRKSKKHLSFQKSDSTFSINSIAVIPKEVKNCSGTVLSADELAAFTETNILSHYNVTDRRHLKAILDEQRLQMSGLTFEETVLESGCIENAQAYLFVREGCLKGDEVIELRLVHCETSTLVWSCTGISASLQEVLIRIDEELSKD